MRRRHIGIVFQFFNLLEGMSVLENVTLPAVIAGTGRKRAESRARDLLDLLGLADKARAPPGCSRAVSASDWPLPAPWPTRRRCCWPTSPPGALDSDGGKEVLELFRRLHAGGQSILLVTHDDDGGGAGDPHRAHARRAHTGRGRWARALRAAAPAAAASRHEHTDNRPASSARFGRAPGAAPRRAGCRGRAAAKPLATAISVTLAAVWPWPARPGRPSSTPMATSPPRWSGLGGGGLRRRRPGSRWCGDRTSASACWCCAAPLWAVWWRRRRRWSRCTPTAGTWGRRRCPWPVSCCPWPWPCCRSPPCTSCWDTRRELPAQPGGDRRGIRGRRGVGVVLCRARPALPLWPVAIEAVVCGGDRPGGSRNDATSAPGGVERQRMQWFGWALAVAMEVLLVALALRVLWGWPTRAPLVVIVSWRPWRSPSPWAAPAAWRAASTAYWPTPFPWPGSPAWSAAVYLVVVVGLGHTPTHDSGRCCPVDGSPPPSPPCSTGRPASASPFTPTAWCTARERRPTPCCAPSAAGCRVPCPWTNCCSRWPSRCERPWP